MRVPGAKIAARKSAGFVTLPAEAGEEKMVARLAREWGADAIRDSDGTTMSPEMLKMQLDVYSTICLVRADQAWPRAHMDQLPQKYLMSDPVMATGSTIVIDPMAGFYRPKYVIDMDHDPKRWWEVIDRTSGKVISPRKWSFDKKTCTLVARGIEPYHVYTVNFLVFQIWDTTSMYNHLTNKWTKPHVISVDPYHRETWDHLMGNFDRWLKDHPRTDVVRLTTLAYHFAVDSDQDAADKFRDWVGYQDTVSINAMMDFEKEYGYRLRPEDFVDQGFYNATCRVPTRAYLDWMQFIHRFVVKFGRALADKAHRAGKRTALFQGDHWVGVEPYSRHFQRMGIDIHVGAAEDGVALRRVSDAPGPQVKELRLYPYFFPDVFKKGGDPLGESMSNWVKIRRALMRKPVDRIGYGGYLSLALKFPAFVDHVGALCREFRTFKEMARGTESRKAPVKVAMLNCWGALRSWLNSFGAPQKFLVKRPDVVMVAGTNLLECLAGLPVEVEFISFDDIAKRGIPGDIDVIINDGDAETAWSGGRRWAEPGITAALREFVQRGGGFIGCRGPTAHPHQGRYFQLADVMGVEKESGQSLQSAPLKPAGCGDHFIVADRCGELDFGTRESFVFVCDRATQAIRMNGGHVLLAARQFGRGRSVFFAGLPYSLENSRLLYRAILWAAGKEAEAKRWICSNVNTDCAYYPEAGACVVVNNVDSRQTTLLHTGGGAPVTITLKPYASTWIVRKRAG